MGSLPGALCAQQDVLATWSVTQMTQDQKVTEDNKYSTDCEYRYCPGVHGFRSDSKLTRVARPPQFPPFSFHAITSLVRVHHHFIWSANSAIRLPQNYQCLLFENMPHSFRLIVSGFKESSSKGSE
ncbi:hypothetical protein BaRGS_00001984 [Batillaria attramentaria]|uniref:Uncharacterized protein n=1 Tax=Batillaria attramentaria TaxID=370345 RepID=A0ABD0M3N0_9CAEN